jgi:hypothetical protein
MCSFFIFTETLFNSFYHSSIGDNILKDAIDLIQTLPPSNNRFKLLALSTAVANVKKLLEVWSKEVASEEVCNELKDIGVFFSKFAFKRNKSNTQSKIPFSIAENIKKAIELFNESKFKFPPSILSTLSIYNVKDSLHIVDQRGAKPSASDYSKRFIELSKGGFNDGFSFFGKNVAK